MIPFRSSSNSWDTASGATNTYSTTVLHPRALVNVPSTQPLVSNAGYRIAAATRAPGRSKKFKQPVDRIGST